MREHTKTFGTMPDGKRIQMIKNDFMYAAFASEAFRDYVLYAIINDMPHEGRRGWLSCWGNIGAIQHWFPGIKMHEEAQVDAVGTEKLSKFEV